MASKEEVKGFLSNFKPCVEKLPNITEKISKLTDDEEFQNIGKTKNSRRTL